MGTVTGTGGGGWCACGVGACGSHAMPWLTGCCPMLAAAAAVASTGTEPLGAVVVLVGSPEVHAFALLWLIIAAS